MIVIRHWGGSQALDRRLYTIGRRLQALPHPESFRILDPSSGARVELAGAAAAASVGLEAHPVGPPQVRGSERASVGILEALAVGTVGESQSIGWNPTDLMEMPLTSPPPRRGNRYSASPSPRWRRGCPCWFPGRSSLRLLARFGSCKGITPAFPRGEPSAVQIPLGEAGSRQIAVALESLGAATEPRGDSFATGLGHLGPVEDRHDRGGLVLGGARKRG